MNSDAKRSFSDLINLVECYDIRHPKLEFCSIIFAKKPKQFLLTGLNSKFFIQRNVQNETKRDTKFNHFKENSDAFDVLNVSTYDMLGMIFDFI